MTTRAQLLSAVLAAPDDDTPRLVFADWLEENGESERAELIRLQCSLADERDKGWSAERVGETMDKIEYIGGKWLAQHLQCGVYREAAHNRFKTVANSKYGILGVGLVRGFIESLSGPLSALLEHGPAIVAENPVAEVTVTDANIGKISPGFPHSRYRIWNTHPADTFGTEVGYALVGYYRSREAAAASLNAAVLRKLLSYRVGGIASSTARRPR